MKYFFALLFCGLTVVFSSCGEKEPGIDDNWFSAAEANLVGGGTTVDFVCQTRFAENVLNASNAGFAYAPMENDGVGTFVEVPAGSVVGGKISCRAEGLIPQVAYVAYAYVDVGSMRMQSAQISFVTGRGGNVPVFGVPSASHITASGATLNCEFSFDDKTDYSVYFHYKASSESDYTSIAVTTESDMKSVTVTGLRPSMKYEFQLFVVRNGSAYYSSVSADFTTLASDGVAGAKYAGWAELPTENTGNTDYFYAYHMRPDAAKIRNYSVCYSARYRSPVWVAAPMHDSYKGSAKRRDNYIDDPNISCTQNTEYNFSATNLTRGHMLGSSDRTVTQATNDQVFYKSNIGAQLQTGFNTGGGLWNNCEDWVDTQWVGKADTTYQVIGCYWQDESKKVNGTIVPTHYYKILLRTKNHVNKWVATCSRDELQCVAVFVPHNSSNGGVKPNQFVAKGFVMSVADLEKKVGQTFFANVPHAPKDTFNAADWGL